MKVVYWKCDRCKEKIDNFREMAIIIFIGKQKELCKECQKDFKNWIQTVRKIKKRSLKK